MSRVAAPSPSLAEVWSTVEELWPSSLAEPWDAIGPVTGDPNQTVKCIVLAVDPTLAVVDDALERGADLLITHHPLLLRGVQSVAANTFKGQVVHRLIENRCGLLTAHTNGDCAIGGVSEVLIRSCGVQDSVPLVASSGGVEGEGLGRVGDLPRALRLTEFAERVYSVLPSVAGGVRVAGDPDGLIRRVAVCGGAGDSLFDEVRESGADVYVTADLRHHPASEAREAAAGGRPYLVDVSHFASEWLWLGAAAGVLHRALQDQGFDVEIAVSSVNTDPWDFILTP
ncbi:MAG: Nif3-like dinuclear metal center hexameric protein [Galactobacter sp.]